MRKKDLVNLMKALIIAYIGFIGFFSLLNQILNNSLFMPLWLLIVIGVVMLEVFFWFDNQKKPEKKSYFWFTVLKKGEALLKTIITLGCLNFIRIIIKAFIENWDAILKLVKTIFVLKYLIIIIILLIGIYIYIKLNSWKYIKKNEKKRIK